jgi:cytochrome c biogenesis protein CcmG, thiol:disulfide interchange protein DsbE
VTGEVQVAVRTGESDDHPPSRPRGLTVAFALAFVLVGLLLAAFAVQLRRPATGPRVGAVAPEVAFTTFDGVGIRLSELRGAPVVLNFWASWCVECVYEASELESVWRDYRDRGVVVLGVDYTDTRDAALAYLAEHGVTYPNGPDRGGAISRAYRLTGVPETLVIDAAGRVVSMAPPGAPGGEVAKVIGPIIATASFTPGDLRGLLDGLLAGGPGADRG